MNRMRIIVIAFVVFALTIVDDAKGQDIHFSQFYFSPMTLNPGHTGFFNGKHRVASNYKTQWKRASGGDPYVTYSASYDIHVLDKMMKAADMTGFGLLAFSDKAGTGDLATSGFLASLAYHRDMLGNGTQLLSFGIQAGMVQTGFDRSKLRFGDEILNDAPAGSGQEIFESTSLVYADVNAGILYNYVYSKTLKFFGGISTYHLTQPQINFLANDKNILSNRTSLQAGAAIEITREWELLPSGLYMIQKASNETNFGMAVKYKTEKEAAIRLGGWYRIWSNSDAAIVMAAYEYMNLTIGLSYDINVSTLRETSKGQGSFEVAMIYIIESRKAITQDISCPHF
ncbi:MAG TPA: type IX secretion system membrane protein PorP/SprF [Flavobacteriales bacterium]|nr:type IX secretion system membrane protein PorP/SprF [Flavobacteriales bacterium]